MSAKRVLEQSAEGETKKPKLESTSKELKETISFKYYPPGSIFRDDGNDPQEMAGSKNLLLAESFYHSRCPEEDQATTDDYDRRGMFNRNAGAVQLYNEDGITLYAIPGQEEHREYNFVSYGNKEFKYFTKDEFSNKSSAYGHSERTLMKMVLDDLISGHGDEEEIHRPSDNHSVKNDEDKKDYEILRNLTNNASKYREYLKKKNIIVKMWSERPSCSGVGAGGGCSTFMQNICPAGSQFGWIVKGYERKDNENGASKVVQAFEEFKSSYLEYKQHHRKI